VSAQPYSLRRRLLLMLLLSIVLIWVGTTVFSYFDARHELDEMLDAHLAQSTALVLAQAGPGREREREREEIDTEHMPQLHKRARSVAIQMWEHGKVLRLHSVSAPAERLSPQDEGFSDATINGKRWRVFSAWDEQHRYLVQVGERYEKRNEIAAALGLNLLVPLFVALPLLGLMVWFSVARALGPLAALGRQVAARDPGKLSSLDAGETPVEVIPLVDNLNRLFERVAQLIENERRFTADASHELRTPLAALKTQAQVALGSTDDAERRHALERVITGCDRATHLVEQLLTLARLDPDQTRASTASCDLQALAREAVAEIAPYALSKGVEIELAAGAALPAPVHAGLVAILLRNLIDNAVRYSPADSRVRVRAAREGAAAMVEVVDQGPGIPAAERDKIGQRFYRILGNEEFGSGLGLSIVKRIVELHGAHLTLADGEQGRGLAVRIAFDAPRS